MRRRLNIKLGLNICLGVPAKLTTKAGGNPKKVLVPACQIRMIHILVSAENTNNITILFVCLIREIKSEPYLQYTPVF